MNATNPRDRRSSLRPAHLGWALTIVCALCLSGHYGEARACTVPPPGWTIGPTASVVPIEGMIVLPATYNPASAGNPTESLARGSLTLVDPNGTPVPGSAEYRADLKLIIWRSATPLSPSATYKLSVSLEFGVSQELKDFGTFELKTRSSSAPTFEAPSWQSFQLTDAAFRRWAACCTSTFVDTCSNKPAELCQTIDFEYRPTLVGNLLRPSNALDSIYEVRRLFVGPDETTAIPGGSPKVVAKSASFGYTYNFTQRQARNCMVVEVESLLDGTKLRSDVRCLDAEQLVPSERQAPPETTPINCSDTLTAKFFGTLDPAGDAPDVTHPSTSTDVVSPPDSTNVTPDATVPGTLRGSSGCQLTASSPLEAPIGLMLVGLFALWLGRALRQRRRTA